MKRSSRAILVAVIRRDKGYGLPEAGFDRRLSCRYWVTLPPRMPAFMASVRMTSVQTMGATSQELAIGFRFDAVLAAIKSRAW